MTETSKKWGGKRSNSGRKSSRIGCQKMETFILPDLKQKAIAKVKQLNISQSEYLKRLIEQDLKQD